MKIKNRSTRLTVATLSVISALTISAPALAHHPFGGTTPSTWMQGFLSGVGHPIIGPDHLIFTVIVGLLATRFKVGWTIPITFLIGGLAGTGFHLIGLNLPAPEFSIALSVVLFGLLSVWERSLNRGSVVLLSAIAGIFHGYAYGEAVVGAEVTPLLFYLIGFTVVQGAIAFAAFGIAKRQPNPAKRSAWRRYVGLIACGAGSAFLSSLVLG